MRKIGKAFQFMLLGSLRALGLKKGDNLGIGQTITKIEQTPDDPEYAEALETARNFMCTHPTAMRALAR